ncbi:hypothetical protein VPH35_061747 [Triticum aestivum]
MESDRRTDSDGSPASLRPVGPDGADVRPFLLRRVTLSRASSTPARPTRHQLTQTEPKPHKATRDDALGRSGAASLTPSRLVVTALHRTAGIADVPQTAAWRSRGQPRRAGSRRDRWAQPVIGGLRLDFGLGGSATAPLDASPRSVADSAPTACCYFPPAGEKAAAASDASPHLTSLLTPAPSRSARRKVLEMAEEKESTSVPLSQAAEAVDPEDPAKSPPRPSSPTTSTRKACCAVLQSWVSRKFMTGCVVLFPVAFTFFITWWFVQFVDGFFSPLYAKLGVNIFGLGFLTSLAFIFLAGIFVSSWLGSTVFWVGEWFIKKMPFVKHIYSASKQVSTAISPDQNTTAFKEVAIIRHPRVGEYAFGFITSTVVLQTDKGDEELCSVYVPTNHLYIGDIFLLNSEEIIRPNLSIREGIGMMSILFRFTGFSPCLFLAG